MKNKSVHSGRFVHHVKFCCIMITLNKLFKIELEKGETGKEPFIGVLLGVVADFCITDETRKIAKVWLFA